VALGPRQFLLGDLGVLVRDAAGAGYRGGSGRSLCAQDPQAFALGGGGEPARECGRVAEVAKLVHQVQPDALAGIGGVGAGQPVPAADGPNQRVVPLDEGIPRLLVAASGARHQVGERPFAADQARLGGRDRVPPSGAGAPSCVVRCARGN
jgi:hypothetical protein